MLNEINKILESLSPEERAAVMTILKEQALTGNSTDLQQLYNADYEEIPVDIDTFLESPDYLGRSTDNGKAIYPYWRDAYRKIIAEDKIECALGGSIGCGKAACLDSYLVGPNGYFKMKDVKVGDLVAGQDGKFYHVTSIWPQGKIPVYKITFSDHTSVRCSIDHLWNVRRTDRPSKKQPYPNPSYVYETKSVRWLLQQDLKIGRGRVDKHGHKLEQNKFAIPCTLPVQFNNGIELPLDPYLLGILIADGGLSGSNVDISIYEQDIKDKVSCICDKYGCELILEKESETHKELGDFRIVGKTRGSNPILKAIKQLSLNVKSVEKHIPKEYLLSTVENRLELLRGMFDGDGYVERGRYMYSTSSKQLYDDFCFLIYSLGGTVNVTEGKEAYRYVDNGNKIKSSYLNYEFTFHLPKALKVFSSKKHTKRFGKGSPFHEMEYRFIESIEPDGEEECQCITVDNPESLYLMDNFTVTHNTTAAVYLMIYFVYRLMCLRNIRQYYGLEGNGPISICFLNNTIQLSKGVAYDKFMSTVANSPWFLDRGEVRGTVNIRYKPKKNIEFILGSSADQIIGRDIFCLAGETQILTEHGVKTLFELSNTGPVRVYTYNNGESILSKNWCEVKQTKKAVELIHITLEDGTIIRCTPEHRFVCGQIYISANLLYLQVHALEGKRFPYLTTPEGNYLHIKNVEYVVYDTPQPVYDVINVLPYHNFIVKTASSAIISHNCAILDEVNFNKSSDIQLEKMKVLETYNACFGRIKNRFTVNGRCQGRIFLVSSKKTEYDFLNQYIEKKMQSVEDAKNLFVADAKAFEVKPKGSYSGRMFRVAVGGSNLPSKIPTDDEATEDLIHQGYEVHEVPVELRGDFELDINRFIADHLGISVSEVIKFMPYNKIEACYKDIQNPFSNEVIYANLSDSIPIKQYFMPNVVPEAIYYKPIFIHLDTSGGKGDKCGISAVACMGYVHRNRYSEETGNEETTKQMLYRHVFSVALDAVKSSEISFQKIVDFLWYLKFECGWNIKAVSTDGYMGQFLRQQISASGFDEVNYVSLDRSPDGYLALQSIFAENRIALIKLKLLETELVRLERNNVTGKIDHPPIDGCFTGDTKIALTDGRKLSILELLQEQLQGKLNYVYTCNEATHKIEPQRIVNVFRTKRSRVIRITLDNNCSFKCTPDHRIMLKDGSYKPASSLKYADAIMSTYGRFGHIAMIETVDEEYDVYDLTIENTPNFALAAGIFVHNSKDVADSLAGAIYNSLKHEDKLQLGNDDLVEMTLTSNVRNYTPSKEDIEESISETKQESIRSKVDFEAEVRRRSQLTYDSAPSAEERPWDPRDGILD